MERFATTLEADAWPAPEVVAAYFGRAGQENRFAQEDRELGLDRILSYHLPGQELAVLVGLCLWNLRLARGFASAPPQPAVPLALRRESEVDERIPRGWPADPRVTALLDELDWAVLLTKRPGWSFRAAAGMLVCPEGRELAMTTVRKAEHAPGRTGLIFRRPTGGCEECSSRGDCLRSERPRAHKHAEVSVPTELAEKLRRRLKNVRAPGKAPAVESPGPRAVQHALFLPAAARRLWSDLFLDASLRVEVETVKADRPRPKLVAEDDADRQHRRKTWAQNVARYALSPDTAVSVEAAGSPKFWALFAGTRTARITSAGGC